MPTKSVELAGRGAYSDEKELTAWLVRKRTSASNAWVAERLAMRHPGSVSREVGRVGKEPELGKRAKRLMAELTPLLKCED